MNYKSPIPAIAVGIAIVMGLASGSVLADVTMEQRISVEGVGIMAAANLAGTTRTAVSGNRSRTDTDLQLQSKIVRFLARNALGPTADIVLLDADRQYHLQLNKKEYTEETFAQMRAAMQKAREDASSEPPQQQAQPSAIDDSKCEWLEPTSDVKKTGEKASIAGYQAEHVIITAEQPCKDKETGAVCEIALTVDEWLAPGFTNREEVVKYQKAYAQKIGLDSTAIQDSADRARAMFSRYQGIWSNVSQKMRDVKGYPVKSSFGLALGGEQCKQAQAARQDDAAAAPESTSAPSGPVTSPAELAGKMGAKLGSLFHRKKEASQPASADPATAAADAAGTTAAPVTGPSGTVTLITVSSELVSVSTAPIAADAFAVPADYKKVESTQQARKRGT